MDLIVRHPYRLNFKMIYKLKVDTLPSKYKGNTSAHSKCVFAPHIIMLNSIVVVLQDIASNSLQRLHYRNLAVSDHQTYSVKMNSRLPIFHGMIAYNILYSVANVAF